MAHMSDNVVAAPKGTDEQVVNRFGYKQELRRRLKFFSMFGMSFSIMSITTGVFLNYTWGLTYMGPAFLWTWPIVTLGSLLIALVVAELGTRIPLAGYTYQWSARLVNPTYGWFVGCFGIMLMMVGSGGITLLAVAPVTVSIFTRSPNPHLVLAVAIVFMIIPVAVNIISVQLAARVNNVAVVAEVLGAVLFSVVLIVLWALRAPSHSHSGASILFSTASLQHHPFWYMVALGSLIGIYTLVGFEVCADLSEEAIGAGLTVPRAVLWAVIACGVLGTVVLIGFTLAIPNLKAIEASATPLQDITQFWLGTAFTKVFLLVVVFCMFALQVVGMAAQARIVFSLSRDNMFPWSKAFRKINPRTQTPVFALVIWGVIDIVVMIYGYSQPNTFGILIAATAIIPYIIYILITVAHMLKREALEHVPGEFSLGRWARPVIYAVLAWSLVAGACVSVPRVFWGGDKVVAAGTVLAALWYFGALRWRLKKGTAGLASIEKVIAQPDLGTGGETGSVK